LISKLIVGDVKAATEERKPNIKPPNIKVSIAKIRRTSNFFFLLF